MAKNSEALDWTGKDRVASMVVRLMEGGRILVKQTANDYRISERQVYRDIAVIDRVLPIKFVHGPDGSYIRKNSMVD